MVLKFNHTVQKHNLKFDVQKKKISFNPINLNEYSRVSKQQGQAVNNNFGCIINAD